MSESNDLRSETASLNGPTESEAAIFHLRQGQKYRRSSIIVGVIGLFVFGIAAGVVAFILAGRAEASGVEATAGKVLGVLDVIGGIIVLTIYVAGQK
jgi:hypothetical protein